MSRKNYESESIRVALAQMSVVAGQPEKNYKTALEHIDRARQQQAEIVVLPEMAIPGYMLGDDKWHDKSFVLDSMAMGAEIITNHTQDIAVVFGNVMGDFRSSLFLPNRPAFGNDGRFLKYNSAFVGQDGQPAAHAKPLPLYQNQTILPEPGATVKTNLPLYNQFDDQRYFLPYKELAQQLGFPLEELLQPFNIKLRNRNVSVGVLICEDIWVGDYIYNGKPLNPAQILVDNGAELLIAVNTSPYASRKNQARVRSLQNLQVELMRTNSARTILSVNAVGLQNNGKDHYTIDGRSSLNQGFKRQEMLAGQEATTTYHVSLRPQDAEGVIPEQKTSKQESRQEIYETLVQGIKNFCRQNGLERLAIGLSGGIDSALVATLATAALGPENVLGVNMPSRFNSDQTKDAAYQLARNLGIAYQVVGIEGTADSVRQSVQAVRWNGVAGTDLTSEYGKKLDGNLQARVRSVDILAAISSLFPRCGYTSNGNKTEFTTGYYTLDGDGRGCLAAIIDLFKISIVDLCAHINDQEVQAGRQALIPWEVIVPLFDPERYFEVGEEPRQLFDPETEGIFPTAELETAQKDPFFFEYHDRVLQYWQEESGNIEELLQAYVTKDWSEIEEKIGVEACFFETMLPKYFASPQEWIQDLERIWGLYSNSTFKHVQSVPGLVISKKPLGFTHRRSMTGTYYTRNYAQLKQDILQQR